MPIFSSALTAAGMQGDGSQHQQSNSQRTKRKMTAYRTNWWPKRTIKYRIKDDGKFQMNMEGHFNKQ